MANTINLEINTSQAYASQNVADSDVASTQGSKSTLKPVLGGENLTISTLGDLDALVAKLKNEREGVKLSLLMKSLSAINSSLSETEKAMIEEGLALVEKLEVMQQDLETYTKEAEQQRAQVTMLQIQIESLEAQIEQARKDGEDHIEQEKELAKLREAQDEAKRVFENTTGKINAVTNEISAVKGKISAIVGSVGENTLKSIALELMLLIGPEKAETDSERIKAEKKLDGTDPFKAIHDSIKAFAQEIIDEIEEKQEIKA